MEPDENLEVQRTVNQLTFRDRSTGCVVIFNTSNSMAYDLVDFSCGNRGQGKGAQLLYRALRWIKANLPRREIPFRIELYPVPSAADGDLNDVERLTKYYYKLGFTLDERTRKLFILFDKLEKNLETIVNSNRGVGGKKKRKTKRRYRNLKKTRKYRHFK